MSTTNAQQLDTVYHALANGCRRRILTRLSQGECSITDLAEPFDMSLAAVSKNIRVLEKAGFIDKRREGSTIYCRLNAEPIRSASALISYLENCLDNH